MAIKLAMIKNYGLTFKNFFLNSFFRITGYLSRFFLFILLLRHLNLEDFGQYGLITVSVIILYQIFGLEYHNYYSRLLAKKEVRYWGKIIINTLIVSFFSFFIFFVLLLIFYYYIKTSFNFIFIIFFIIVIEYLLTELIRLYYINGNTQKYNFFDFLKKISLPFIILFQVLMGVELNLELILYDWIVGLILISFFLIISLRNLKIIFKKKYFKADKNFIYLGLKISFIYLISLIFQNTIFVIDRYIVKFYFDTNFLAAYIFFISIAIMPYNFIQGLIFSKYFKNMVNISNEKIEFLKESLRILLKVFITLIVFNLLIILLIEEIVKLTNKNELLEYTTFLNYILIIGSLFSLKKTFDFILHATNYDKLILISNVILTLTFITILIIFKDNFFEKTFLYSLIIAFILAILFNIFNLIRYKLIRK